MAQEKFTMPELMFVQEHLRSCSALTKLLDYASQASADPEIKSLCDRLAREHKSEIGAYSSLIGARGTLQ